MTTLLVDLGNTALKWTTLDEPDNPHTIVHRGSTHFNEELCDLWLNLRPSRILGCTVAAPAVALSLTNFFNTHGISWKWAKAQPEFHGDRTIRNCYANPCQLGADRWFAGIGAVEVHPNESLLVVHTGTATTVDSIICGPDGNYSFTGGRIAPGPTMMRDALSGGIPSLPGTLGDYSVYPKCTAEAIATGIIDSQVGLVMRARHMMIKQGVTPRVVLAGGAAKFIAPYLKEEIEDLSVRHNLVLHGLASMARHIHG